MGAIKLSYEGGEFVCRTLLYDKASARIPRKAGFYFDSNRLAWFSESIKEAALLRAYADKSAKTEIDSQTVINEPWYGRLPYPSNLTPLDFQTDPGALFILDRNRSYLAAEAGTGKTIMAAIATNALQSPTVIICPPFLTRNVEAEFSKWSTWSPRIRRIEPNGVKPHEPDILIVPDSLIHNPEVFAEIKNISDWGSVCGREPFLIVDEAHRFVNDSRRSKTLYGTSGSFGVCEMFPRQAYLSGTPMPNRTIELYPVLSKVAPSTIDYMTRQQFGMRYCDGKEIERVCPRCHGKRTANFCAYCSGKGNFANGYDFNGDSRTEELNRRIMGTFMLRLWKKDVLKGLTPKTEEIVIIGDAPAKIIAMEQKILAKYSLEDIMKGKVSSENTATYRRELGSIKVKPAVDFITSLLEDTKEPVVVFAFHKDVIARLTDKLKKYKPLVITGELTDMNERNEIVKRFQRGESDLFIGNYVACGVGLTLTRSRFAVLVEFAFTPGVNDQAIDRVHRIGQKGDVHSYYLLYNNSIDKKTMEINFRKKRITGYF